MALTGPDYNLVYYSIPGSDIAGLDTGVGVWGVINLGIKAYDNYTAAHGSINNTYNYIVKTWDV